MLATAARRGRKTVAGVLGRVVDATVAFSFDRTGFLVHSLGFEATDVDVDLSGRVCLVTGANAGLGRATTEALAQRGADVWMLCRGVERARAVAREIRKATGNDRVRVAQVDVSERSSIRAFARSFREPKIDVLVNNAGVLPPRRLETSDGLELTFATNVLGPFLLTRLLEPRLRAAQAARVVMVSSGGMYARRLRVDDLQWERRPFDGVAAYAETKRAEVVLTELFAERLAGSGVTVHSMHPGWARTPGVETSLPNFFRITNPLLRTPEEGADTIVWLACAPGVDETSGLFWFDRAPRSTHWLPVTRESDADRHRLWRICSELCDEVVRD